MLMLYICPFIPRLLYMLMLYICPFIPRLLYMLMLYICPFIPRLLSTFFIYLIQYKYVHDNGPQSVIFAQLRQPFHQMVTYSGHVDIPCWMCVESLSSLRAWHLPGIIPPLYDHITLYRGGYTILVIGEWPVLFLVKRELVILKKRELHVWIYQFWWLVKNYFNSWWLAKEAFF